MRQQQLAAFQRNTFDVLIIGGGIVGAGIARDAAMRGLKVALIEQGDFASGTSSKTSKLIHGGLRYLEHGHGSLVVESLRERQILRTIAPAYVRPLSLMLPVYAGDARPAWKVRLGLSLYDLLAGGTGAPRHRMLSPKRALALEPKLRMDGLRAAGLYMDCQMDDARLCLLNILQAVEFGAVCVNYARLRSFLRGKNGRVCGGVVEDVLTGRALEIQATAVINATGPWADRVRRLSRAEAAARIAPTKGVHLIVPKLSQEALFVQARDGRMLFILPWGGYTLIGTTESPVGGSLEELAASADDVGYLLEETHRLLPGAQLAEEQIIATFAGARPLLAFSGAATRASREHQIEIDARGLISVMGGKYTTYRRMAQQAVDLLARRHRWRVDRCLSDQVSLLETVHPVAMGHWQDLARTMDPDLLGRLMLRYGAGVFSILRLMAQNPALAQPVCPHHELLAAELAHGFQHELACTITDVLARRSRIAFSVCQGLDLLSLIAAIAQQYAGLSSDMIERQIDAYHQFLRRGLAFRNGHLTTGALAEDD